MIYPTARKVSGPQDVQAIADAMGKDNRLEIMPTHIIEKNGEVVGHWSINSMPLLLAWHHDNLKGRESLVLINTIKTLMNDRGHKQHMIGLSKESPYNDYFPRIGYNLLGSTNLYTGGQL